MQLKFQISTKNALILRGLDSKLKKYGALKLNQNQYF